MEGGRYIYSLFKQFGLMQDASNFKVSAENKEAAGEVEKRKMGEMEAVVKPTDKFSGN